MRWRNLLWTLILVGLNLFLLEQVVQLWWTAMEPRYPGTGRRPPPSAPAVPEATTQPLAVYRVVSSRNLFSSSRQEAAKTTQTVKETGLEDKGLLLGTIIIGKERVALVTSKNQANVSPGAIETLRVGESWQGYQVRAINPEGIVLEHQGRTWTLRFPDVDWGEQPKKR